MKYIIDRMDQDVAICETQQQTAVTIERRLLPLEAKEGDMIVWVDGSYRIDTDATAERREKMLKKMAGLFE